MLEELSSSYFFIEVFFQQLVMKNILVKIKGMKNMEIITKNRKICKKLELFLICPGLGKLSNARKTQNKRNTEINCQSKSISAWMVEATIAINIA